MIEVLGTAGLLAFAIVSIATGARCLALGRRTRGVPEISVGLGFVIGAVVGYVPETIVLSTDLAETPTGVTILAITQIAIRCAAAAVIVFTVYVFRPHSIWASTLGLLVMIILAVSWLAFPSTRTHAQNATDVLWYDIFALARSLPLAWGASESLFYYRKSQRQLRLGLVNPLVANRFLLWGVGLGAMTLLMASTLLAPMAGVDPAVPGWVLLESSVGLVGAIALWLTFFPPASYRAFIQSGADPVRTGGVARELRHG